MSSALPGAPDETIQQIFLTYIDDFTPWHLRLLAFFDDPAEWGRKVGVRFPSWQMGSPALVLEHSMREMAGQRGFYDIILSTLEQRGLLMSGGFHTTMTAVGMFSSRTTGLGKEFLQFISRR